MKISVLLPAYNAEATIRQAIASVSEAAQIVVVDDASTDNTLTVAASCYHFAPVEIVRLFSRLGVTGALLAGMRHCEGDYIARQDADDISLPGRLRIQAQYLDEHPGVVLAASRTLRVSDRGTRIGCRVRWFPAAQLWLRNPIIHGSAMMRRESVERVGGYREPFGLAQDLDLWLRLRRVGRLHILPDVLYASRQHAGQVSLSHRAEQRAYAALARWVAI